MTGVQTCALPILFFRTCLLVCLIVLLKSTIEKIIFLSSTVAIYNSILLLFYRNDIIRNYTAKIIKKFKTAHISHQQSPPDSTIKIKSKKRILNMFLQNILLKKYFYFWDKPRRYFRSPWKIFKQTWYFSLAYAYFWDEPRRYFRSLWKIFK